MVQYALDLNAYSLKKAVASDCAENDYDCLVINLGRNDYGRQVESLQHLISVVDHHLSEPDELEPIRKLYILGAWNLTSSKEECEGWGEERECHEGEPHVFTKQEEEWHEAGKKIAKLVAGIPKLEELTWISSLPFTAHVWEGLSTSMTKIVLDIGNPVRLLVDGFTAIYKSYITSNELKPLVQQTKLRELRLFHMQDSHQPVVWETVYRNTNEDGMRLLDLTMAFPPLVRPEHWREANDVAGLTIAISKAGEKEYKGIDGKGILHYSFGTGEYLDNFCMRKARIAAQVEAAKPLPLHNLKLDGFVIDHLPFEEELTGLKLLTCGEKCIDAGLRAPKTRHAPNNRWSGAINDVLSRCKIIWPNWHGTLDAGQPTVAEEAESEAEREVGEGEEEEDDASDTSGDTQYYSAEGE